MFSFFFSIFPRSLDFLLKLLLVGGTACPAPDHFSRWTIECALHDGGGRAAREGEASLAALALALGARFVAIVAGDRVGAKDCSAASWALRHPPPDALFRLEWRGRGLPRVVTTAGARLGRRAARAPDGTRERIGVDQLPSYPIPRHALRSREGNPRPRRGGRDTVCVVTPRRDGTPTLCCGALRICRVSAVSSAPPCCRGPLAVASERASVPAHIFYRPSSSWSSSSACSTSPPSRRASVRTPPLAHRRWNRRSRQRPSSDSRQQ